jgi:hypothetical protein
MPRLSPWLVVFALAACAEYQVVVQADGGGGGGGGDGGVLDDGGTGGDGGTLGMDGGIFVSCVDVGGPIVVAPLDLMVLLDVSYSMDYDDKWLSVKSALKSFTTRSDSAGLGIGLQYFPLRAQCRVDAYQAPAVPIGVLPNNATVIGNSLDLQQMSGGTPTVQALEGTTAYTKTWLSQHPTHKSVVVMATDGVPDETCAAPTDAGLSNSLDDVLVVARGAATSSPPVKTFVIGVGKSLTALNQIADAGGTTSAILVDTAMNADVAFLAALNQIRHDALGCVFTVPNFPGVQTDHGQVTFAPDDAGSPTITVPSVVDAAHCVNGQGWYFDDPTMPTKLNLCDGTCESITQGQAGQLHVEFECGPT